MDSYPVMGRIALGQNPRNDWKKMFLTLKEAGISHIALTTTGQNLTNIEDHEELIQLFLEDIYGLVDPFMNLYLDLSLVFRGEAGNMGFVLDHRSDLLFHKLAEENPTSVQKTLVDFLSAHVENVTWSNLLELEKVLSQWPEYARDRGFDDIRESFKSITVQGNGFVVANTDGLPGKIFLGTMNFEYE